MRAWVAGLRAQRQVRKIEKYPPRPEELRRFGSQLAYILLAISMETRAYQGVDESSTSCGSKSLQYSPQRQDQSSL